MGGKKEKGRSTDNASVSSLASNWLIFPSRISFFFLPIKYKICFPLALKTPVIFLREKHLKTELLSPLLLHWSLRPEALLKERILFFLDSNKDDFISRESAKP